MKKAILTKIIIASVAIVAIIASTTVYAQYRSHHPSRFSDEDRAAFADARIAAVKAGLQLTPDQEKMWPPVEAAVRDFAKQRIALAKTRATEREARRAERDQQEQGAGTPPNPVARLRERADTMINSAVALKRIADAADPLYKSLDDAQKRRLAILTQMGGHRGMRGHGFRDRDDGMGGNRGSRRDHGPEPQRL